MASPYTQPSAPLPPPPPVYGYRRSLTGPLILIVIGMLFLLRNLGVHLPVWHFFGKYWPLLIILWGVIALIEHFTALKHGYRTRGLGGGGIFLLILIVVVGLAAHHSGDVNWEGMRDQIQIGDEDLGGMFGSSFTFEDTIEQSFPAKGSLRIVSDRGAINVTPSDGNTIRVVVHKKLYAKSQEDANKFNEGSKPQITVSGTSVVLNANTNGAGDHGVSTDMEIFLPADAVLEVASKRGDVTITGHKADVKLTVQRGDVNLADLGASAHVNLDKGSIRATKIAGDVDIDGRVDDVTLEEVKGGVRLSGDFFNNIRLSRIAKVVEFKSARSDITIAGVPGDLEISGDALRATDVTGPIRLVTRSKEIHLEGVNGDVEVENSNGDIEIHAAGKVPVGRMMITGKHGDVILVLPPNAGFTVDATTRKGEITSDFSPLRTEQTNGASRTTGTIGNGAAKLQINSDTGDIRINKG